MDEGQLLLAHFKENNGTITADVLNAMGIYGLGDSKPGGWLYHNPTSDDLVILVEEEYMASREKKNLAAISAEFSVRQQSEAFAFTAMMVAYAAGTLMDIRLNASASAPLGGGEGKFNLGEAPGAGGGGRHPPPHSGLRLRGLRSPAAPAPYARPAQGLRS